MEKIKVAAIPLQFETKEDAKMYRDIINYQHGILPSQTIHKETQEHVKSQAKNLWIDEAIVYIGLDRTGIKRPDKAIHRLINKGALHPRKISGRLSFDREELDRMLENGDHKKGRGRPRKW